MFKKLYILFFICLFLFSCGNNNVEENEIVNIENANSGSTSFPINGNLVSNDNLENQNKYINEIISFFPNSNIDESSINFFINNLMPYFSNKKITSLDDIKLGLKEYHDNISDIEEYKSLYNFISDSDSNIDLDIDILKWIETPGINPSIIGINKLIDFYYSQEDPYFLWDPSELENGNYTYIQGVLEFLTFCEDYNKDKLSIFSGYEDNHLKEEYFGDYNLFLEGKIHSNTLVSKYRKRQAIHLSEMDFTEPSFIEPFKALYNDTKLNCGEVIENYYNKVHDLGNIQ